MYFCTNAFFYGDIVKVLGIVAEYNPFHNGHLYHLTESKKISGAEYTIVVMSGNFVQRGDVAVLSKWERAKIAIDCGVDLVLELPFVYACNSAEFFAKGAIQILDGLSCVELISFGSEIGEIGKLKEIANLVSHETSEFKQNIKFSLDEGNSFPRARAEAIRKTTSNDLAEIIGHPNNILAVEYIKELMSQRSNITPITVLRKGQADNSVKLAEDFASATGIRKSLEEHDDVEKIRQYVPAQCFDNMQSLNINIIEKNEKMFLLLCAKILSESEKALEELFSAGEGLGNKLKKAIREAESLENLIDIVKSKRYTRTRIQRLLIHTLFDFKRADFQYILNNNLNYTRVLGFNNKGAKILKQVKKNESKIPVITNLSKQITADEKIMKLLWYDILAADIYNLISEKDIYDKSDFVVAPYNVKS